MNMCDGSPVRKERKRGGQKGKEKTVRKGNQNEGEEKEWKKGEEDIVLDDLGSWIQPKS